MARCAHRVDHRRGLGVGVQVGVEAVGRLVVAQVVGGHHGVALGGEEGGQQQGFGVLRVGQVARLVDVGAARVGQQRRGVGGAGRAGGAAGQQHDARGVGVFAGLGADGGVVQGHHLDIAHRRPGERLQAAGGGGAVDLGGAQRGQRGGRIDQLAAAGAGVTGAAAGHHQGGAGRDAGQSKQGHGMPFLRVRNVTRPASSAQRRATSIGNYAAMPAPLAGRGGAIRRSAASRIRPARDTARGGLGWAGP